MEVIASSTSKGINMSYYDDYDDDYDYDYDDYDVIDHMTNDPIDFQIYGYGGFGYDTSHIAPDEERSEMCISASKGDLHTVMDIVEQAAAISDEDQRRVINYARRWTEVDYRASGFTKEWTWFDLSPVAAAAIMGHHEVVQYLLEQGADPTLKGCPDDSGSFDALGAAKRAWDFGRNNAISNNLQRCTDLVTVANLFWNTATYANPHYSATARAKFSNRCKNNRMLQEALQSVPAISEYPEKKLSDADLEHLKETAISPINDYDESKCVPKIAQQPIILSGGAGKGTRGTRHTHVSTPLRTDSYDHTEVTFFRPDGDTETKDVQWCLDNGFFEVEKGLWSGKWYYEKHGNGKNNKSSRSAVHFSLYDISSPPHSKNDTATTSKPPVSNTDYLTIRIRDQVGQTKRYKLKPTTKMKRMFDTYTKQTGVDSDSLHFKFCGVIIQPDETPATLGPKLGLKDDSIIKCCRNPDMPKFNEAILSGFVADCASQSSLRQSDPPSSNRDPVLDDARPMAAAVECNVSNADAMGEQKLSSEQKKKKAASTSTNSAPSLFTFGNEGSTAQESKDEKKINSTSFSFSHDKANVNAILNNGEQERDTSPFSFDKAAAIKPSFSVGSSEKKKKKKATMKTTPINTSNLFSETFEHKDVESPFHFGKAAVVKPSFSVGSSEKKKKMKATINTTPINNSNLFGSSFEHKDVESPFSFGKAAVAKPSFSCGSSEKKKAATSTSANRQTQDSSVLFRVMEGKTSSLPYHFGCTASTLVGGPPRSGTSPSPTFVFGSNVQSPVVPKTVSSKFDSNKTNLISIESAISMLESLPTHEILPHHAARIKVLAQMLEGAAEKKDVVRPTLLEEETPKRASIERDDARDDHFGHICSAVFDDEYLLSSILYFVGSLAMSETCYDWFVGIENPKPYSTEDLFRVHHDFQLIEFIRQSGTPSNALVCKKWKSFVLGEKGREALKIILNEQDKKLINLAKEVVGDKSMPWSARILAMAIANDTTSLYRALEDREDESQGIGAAFKEAGLLDYDDQTLRSLQVECPSGHPFYQQCLGAQNFERDVTCYREDTVDDWCELFSSNIAYAAASVGSVGALSILREAHGPGLCSTWFDDKGGNFIGNLVLYSCRFPLLGGLVSSIQYLLEHDSSDHVTLHLRHFGCNGNSLHLAAARGHKSLVKALLEGGMDPCRPCTRISSAKHSDLRDRCVKELPLASDWASVRGHHDVASLLRQHQSILRPDLRSPNLHYQTGKLSKFFPDRGYGFIQPEGVFVHLTKLRWNSEDSNGYPSPGQKLCFTVTTDSRRRKRAHLILDGIDFSHLRLPLPQWEAEMAWQRYEWCDSDFDESDEDSGY